MLEHINRKKGDVTMEFKDIFRFVMEYCREHGGISEVAYSLWLKCLEPVKFDTEHNLVILRVPNQVQKTTIETNFYLALLKTAFQHVLGFEVFIKIISADNEEENAPYKEKELELPHFSNEVMEQNSRGGEYDYTFDTFIVGSSNKFAHAVSLAASEKPGTIYNPLVIYGGSGLGKTHLLNAIKLKIRENFPHYKIIYVKGETFTNELIDSLKQKTTTAFHNKYRNADVLLMDDIQFIAGKESTQEEFFHTFEALHNQGKQIVVTSDRAPKEIKTLEDRIRTRFEWGLLADIQKPEFETRVAIIKRKAELLNLDIPDDVCEFMANRLKNNIRQLEGTVKKMKAYKELTGSEMTISLAQTSIRDILNENQPVSVTMEVIINEVARTFGIDAQEIRSRSNKAQVSNARQAAIYAIREITQMPLTEIGKEFDRDHATMSYALKKVEAQMEEDEKYRLTIEDIIKNLQKDE